MRKKKAAFQEPKTLLEWIILLGKAAELAKKNPRKRFPKLTKLAVLADQQHLCKECFTYLEVAEFDHIDGDRSNNAYSNCQALCPNCHAKKTRRKSM